MIFVAAGSPDLQFTLKFANLEGVGKRNSAGRVMKDNFITHLMALQPATLLMIAAGGFIGFWVPFRRLERNPVVKANKAL